MNTKNYGYTGDFAPKTIRTIERRQTSSRKLWFGNWMDEIKEVKDKTSIFTQLIWLPSVQTHEDHIEEWLETATKDIPRYFEKFSYITI